MSGCGWLGDIVYHVHVHGIMGGPEGDERRKGDLEDHGSHLGQIICAENDESESFNRWLKLCGSSVRVVT